MSHRIFTALFVAIAAVITGGCGGPAAPAGPPAPDFEFLPAGGGKAFQLSSLRGKVVVLKFWGSWCSDCIREMPKAKELYDKYKSRDVVFLGIAGERKAGADHVLKVSAEHGNGYPQMLDHKDKAKKVADKFGVSWIPTVIVVDRHGSMVHRTKSLEGKAFLETRVAVDRALAG